MDTTDDGIEPMGEAPEVTAARPEWNGFVPQTIPLNIDGTWQLVSVPGQTTECPRLVITPAVWWTAGRLQYRGTFALTHTGSGALLGESADLRRLEKLATALKDFDWGFTAREHLFEPGNAAMAKAVRRIVAAWFTETVVGGVGDLSARVGGGGLRGSSAAAALAGFVEVSP